MSPFFLASGADGDPTRTSSSSAGDDRAPRSETLPANAPTVASRRVWDRLSEQERREQLDSMDPDALRSMAASMPVIEQAKGVLMGCYGCDATAAFSILVRLSSAKNIKLRDVAALVVEAAGDQSRSGDNSATSPTDRVRRVLQTSQGDDSAHADTSGRSSGRDDQS